MAKVVSSKALVCGYPVVLLSARWNPQALAELLSGIQQPIVVVLDELDKLYPEPSEQESLLSILDGIYNGPRLWMLSANVKYRISSFMINRPSRIFYLFEYSGLTPDVIKSYCEEHGLSPQVIDEITAVTSLFADFNFDMLQALVEEVVRYGERPSEALKWLNISQNSFGQDSRSNWELSVSCEGISIFRNSSLRRSAVEILSEGLFAPTRMSGGKFLPYSDEDDEDGESSSEGVSPEEIDLVFSPNVLDFSGMKQDPRQVRGRVEFRGHVVEVLLRERKSSSQWFNESHLDLLT